MKMNSPLSLLLCGALAVTIGCKNDSTGGGALKPETFATQLAEASCEGGVQCGLVIATDIAACKTQAKANATKATPYDPVAAAKAGRLKFDAAKAKACIAAAKNPPSCSPTYQFFGTDCLGIFTPTVANGGACQSGQECLSGACVGSTSDGCAGTCATPVATGTECDNTTKFCGPSDFCAFAQDAMEGDPGTCTTYTAPGAACTSSNDCDQDHWCRGTAAAPADKLCREPGGVGDPCELFFFNIFHSCNATLFCEITDLENATGVCKALVAKQSTCTDGTDCAPGSTCTGLVFNDSDGSVMTPGTCLPFLAPGAACDPMQSYTNCPSEYPCDMETSTCKKPELAIGSDCAENYCQSGLYCDNALTCQVPAAFGQACTARDMNVDYAEEPCTEGTCVGGTCTLVCM